MARKKQTNVITEAKPHTVKKFELIERYVDEWARKILGFNGIEGREGSRGVVFIDCMCNSGRYTDIDGNLIEGTALRVAKRLNTIIQGYPGRDAILIFNDMEEDRVQHLRKEIEDANLTNIAVSYNVGDCNAFLRGLNISTFSNQYNTLLLYDPYRAAIDWDAIKPYLNRWGEVIINHMMFDTSRGAAQAKKPEVIDRYQETYQRDISLLAETNKDDLDDIIVSIIRNNVNKSASNYYISIAPFYNRTNGRVYSLIHCSGNIKGIRLYKKVTWQTFGDRSSMHTHSQPQGQLMFDLGGTGDVDTLTDIHCYDVHDIAKYIYHKYKSLQSVSLEVIYKDLDEHPVFPSDGYKDEIKRELKQFFGVTFPRGGNAIFPIE